MVHTKSFMRIENWILKSTDNFTGLILPENFQKSETILIGNIYDCETFPDGTLISVSEINKFSEESIQNSSDEFYELGEKHSDYTKFINASKNNIPIITNWRMYTYPLPIKGAFIKMQFLNPSGEYSRGIITPYKDDENLYIINGSYKAFIDWLSINIAQDMSITFDWSDKQKSILLPFAHRTIKPNLNLITKDLFL